MLYLITSQNGPQLMKMDAFKYIFKKYESNSAIF